MKAIKINPETKTIEVIEIEKGYKNIYPAIGNGCTTFTCPITYPNNDTMYCDDESLFKEDEIKGGFMFPKWNYPIVGNAVILGTDEDGESIDAKSHIDEFKDIIWVSEDKAKEWASKFN